MENVMSTKFDSFVESCRDWNHETRAIALMETGPGAFSISVINRANRDAEPLFTGTFSVGEIQDLLERLPAAPLSMPQHVAERYPRNALEEFLPRLEGQPKRPVERFEPGVVRLRGTHYNR